MALAQAHEVQARLASAHGIDPERIEIRVIKTTGDAVTDRPLSEIGGKGLFTKEIEEALLDRSIDIAVHSMKDMQSALPDGLTVGAVLPREDVRDAFISHKFKTIGELPEGATVGTSSLRRKAQLLHRRPDVHVVDFRGNVQTRLKKLEAGIAEATFLAVAGLRRLGMEDRISSAIPTEDMLPAVAQGAIGLEIRSGDEETARTIAALNDAKTAIAVEAERAFLARLEGSCRTPIAGHAVVEGDRITLRGQVLSLDGRSVWNATQSGALGNAAEIGDLAALEILKHVDPKILLLTGRT